MNSRDNPSPLLPDAPKGKLFFEDEGPPPQDNAPATSGQVGQKSKGGKLRLETEQPRLSERLRHEDGGLSLELGQRKVPQSTVETAEAPPTPGAANAAPDGGASAGGATPKPDKKAVRGGKKLNKSNVNEHEREFMCSSTHLRSKLRMEKTGDKLDAARDKLAAHNVNEHERQFMYSSTRLRSKPPKKPGVIKNAGGVVKAEAWMAVHGKIYQAEHENVGVKAAHRTELAGEGAVRGVTRFVKHRVRTRPARRVRKWERKDIKARADQAFRTMARDNPALKSNAVSRYMQKRRLRKQYQKQARGAAKTTGTLAQKTVEAVRKIGSAIVRSVAAHPVSALIVIAAFLLIVTMQSCVGGALTVGHGLLGAISGTSYLAEDGDINAAELAYSEWEADLLFEAQNAESSHPGYDEYRFDIDPVGHDPIALISFLTTKYDNFTFAGVESALRDIFNEQYSLTFTEIVEVRYRTEYYTDEDGDEQSREVPYDYYILETTLTAQPFADVIGPLLITQDDQDRYDIYNITKGNRQYVGSPFPFDWRPYVSCLFGWRVHPITGAKDFHRAIDIAVPAGTPILAGGDGVVVEATTHELYGLTVKIDYGDGIAARYSHCSALLVSVGQTVQAGDTIAHVGSTGASTGPHLDIEILKDGELLNPLYFLDSPF